MASLSTPRLISSETSRAKVHVDWFLVLAVSILMIAGLLSLFSVDSARSGPPQFKKQILNTIIGIAPFLLFFKIGPGFWRKAAPYLYGVNIALLLAVFKLGVTVKGATRWLNIGPLQFQPSEVAKLIAVLTLAAFFAGRQDRIDKPSTFFLSFLYLAPPLILVFKQPHLGATLVLLTIWLSVSLAAGVKMRYIFGTVLAAVLVMVVAIKVPGVLSQYQLDRVSGLFEKDEQGKGYQALRAQIAFGVGGVLGTGFRQGEQKAGGYIPEQHNDFIFTVIGEEGGLVGCTIILSAFGLLFYRIWLIMFRAAEPYYRMLAGGVLAIIGFHAIANIGMNLQLLPVVGLWLPFLSSGGTAIWLCLACVGLLLNIQMRERESLF